MSELTFRDFAGAIMADDAKRAAEVLAVLLMIDEPAATEAVGHFRDQAKVDPAFMMKAMGLRAAVTGGTDDEMSTLLTDCFGITETGPVVVALKKRYPRS